MQDKEAANIFQLNEMRDQKSMFEGKLAQSAQIASDQRTDFEERLAQAAQDTCDMRDA